METEKTVSLFEHEGTVAQMERTIKRLWIALVVSILVNVVLVVLS